jgi:flavodoxin
MEEIMSANLVIYFSRRGENYFGGKLTHLTKGNAEQLAEFISDIADADMFEIRTVRSYPEDYNSCTEEAKSELRVNARPKLKEYLDDIDGYKNIFIVGPCWWGTYPMAMFTQLERLDFKGKKVFPVMTHEGSGMGSAERDLKKMCKGAKFVRGLAVQGSRTADSQKTVSDWVRKNL